MPLLKEVTNNRNQILRIGDQVKLNSLLVYGKEGLEPPYYPGIIEAIVEAQGGIFSVQGPHYWALIRHTDDKLAKALWSEPADVMKAYYYDNGLDRGFKWTRTGNYHITYLDIIRKEPPKWPFKKPVDYSFYDEDIDI